MSVEAYAVACRRQLHPRRCVGEPVDAAKHVEPILRTPYRRTVLVPPASRRVKSGRVLASRDARAEKDEAARHAATGAHPRPPPCVQPQCVDETIRIAQGKPAPH
eukprot:2549643-Pleurochrysis_carterae.AAC.1